MPPYNRSREEEVLLTLTEHALKINDLQDVDGKLDLRVQILERILVLGEGDRKPLIQTMRDMERKLEEFILSRTQKDVKEEMEEAKRAEKVEANRIWLRRALISAAITFTLTVIVPSIWQIILFWTKVYPLLQSK